MTDPATTRDRILDTALGLAARQGSDGMSMRELADACGLNVAALYYHFPSKADLLRSIIAERHYDRMLAEVSVPPRGSGTDDARLAALIVEIWNGMRGEEQIWRLLLAESCHHNTDAQDQARELVERFEAVATTWLHDEFDELHLPVAVAARLLADFLFANIARVAIAAVTDDVIAARAGDLAEVIFDPR